MTRAAVLGDQASHLGTREAADLLEIGLDGAFIGLAETKIAQLSQRLFDPLVGLLAGQGFEIQGQAACQKAADLIQVL